jgi:hypothetical protein
VTAQITVKLYEADAVTPVDADPVDVNTVVSVEFEDPIGPDGSFELVAGRECHLRNDLRVDGRVLEWSDDGTPVYWSVIAPGSEEVLKAKENRSKIPQTITVKGPSLLGQWADARVVQWTAMRHWPYYTRHYNYASPGKNLLIDQPVYEHAPVMDYDEWGQATRPAQPPPNSWRETTAQRIWTAPFSGDQPTGPSLLKTSIASNASTIWRSHQTMDDRGIGWLAGVPFFKPQEYPAVMWHDTWPETVLLEQFTAYELVYRVQNEASVSGASIAWLGHASWLLPTPTAAITNARLACVSDSTWTGLDCSSTPIPGWTVPDVLDQFLFEQQLLGYLTGWVVADMTPGDWEEHEEITFEVGRDTGLTMLQSFQTNNMAEFTFDVFEGQKRVLCYAPGKLGNYHLDASAPKLADTEIIEHSALGV